MQFTTFFRKIGPKPSLFAREELLLLFLLKAKSVV